MKKSIIIIIAIVAGVLTFNSCSKSYDPGDWSQLPDYPTKEEDSYDGPTQTIKVMSVNMALGNNAGNFPTMVNMIKAYDPDLLFLRQVDSKTTRANGIDRPQVIADELGMNVFFKGREYGGGHFGNAALSKFPVTEEIGEFLTFVPGSGEQRMLAMVKTEVSEGVFVYFGGTELQPAERRVQAIDILRVTEDLEDPVFLLGNFNEQDGPNAEALPYLKGTFNLACPAAGCTFNAPKANPNGVYDYITYQDPSDKIIVDSFLEPFKNPETANNFYPTVATFKIKLED